ncbi:MAG: hypothetical protein VYD64_04445, partial [Pseudomonadota bacterium]|nr:hypothetical protein [Pseudomonadota bacterium]
MMNTSSHPARPPMRVQRIESSLFARTISLARREGGAGRVLVMLEDGQGRLAAGPADDGRPAGDGTGKDDGRVVIAPGLAWLAQPQQTRLHLQAGTTGHVAEISEDTLMRAIGDFAESATLMFMADRDLTIAFERASTARARIRDSLEAVIGESNRPQAGTAMTLVAHMRIILVQMLRGSGLEDTAGPGR